jgi:hypothetical protein
MGNFVADRWRNSGGDSRPGDATPHLKPSTYLQNSNTYSLHLLSGLCNLQLICLASSIVLPICSDFNKEPSLPQRAGSRTSARYSGSNNQQPCLIHHSPRAPRAKPMD